ncbi:13563_t:CDS:2, partial [Racocetra persica]
GVLGSIVPLALIWNSTTGSVNDGTYIGFMVLMAFGSLLAMTLLPPNKVIHWRMIALFPMFIASNWFYAYRRTRGIIGITILTVILMGTWIGDLLFQLSYKREDDLAHMDLYDSDMLNS